MALVEAIVRGPQPYFDGKLNPPGAVVLVDDSLVSEDDTYEVDVKVRLKEPIMHEGKLVREATETVTRRVMFRPLEGNARAEGPVPTPRAATAELDRLDVDAFLQKSVADIETAIGNGTVDAHLGAIEQAEIAGKGRKGVHEAVVARRSAISA